MFPIPQNPRSAWCKSYWPHEVCSPHAATRATSPCYKPVTRSSRSSPVPCSSVPAQPPASSGARAYILYASHTTRHLIHAPSNCGGRRPTSRPRVLHSSARYFIGSAASSAPGASSPTPCPNSAFLNRVARNCADFDPARTMANHDILQGQQMRTLMPAQPGQLSSPMLVGAVDEDPHAGSQQPACSGPLRGASEQISNIGILLINGSWRQICHTH